MPPAARRGGGAVRPRHRGLDRPGWPRANAWAAAGGVVGHTHALLARLRRLVVRNKKLDDIHLAFLALGCAFACHNRINRLCWVPLASWQKFRVRPMAVLN